MRLQHGKKLTPELAYACKLNGGPAPVGAYLILQGPGSNLQTHDTQLGFGD